MNSRYSILNDPHEEILVSSDSGDSGGKKGPLEVNAEVNKVLDEGRAIGEVLDLMPVTRTPFSQMPQVHNEVHESNLMALRGSLTTNLAIDSMAEDFRETHTNFEIERSESPDTEDKPTLISRKDLAARKLTNRQLKALLADKLMIVDSAGLTRYGKIQ